MCQSMPDLRLSREKVQFTYSGYRALVSTDGGCVDPTSVSHEELIDVAPSGLVTVVGGKLSTARINAVRAVDRVIKMLGRSKQWSPSRTHRLPLGEDNDEYGLAYWCRNEMVCTLEDLVERRGGSLHWSNETRLEYLKRSAEVIRDELDMDEAEFEEQLSNYAKYLQRFHTLPEQYSSPVKEYAGAVPGPQYSKVAA